MAFYSNEEITSLRLLNLPQSLNFPVVTICDMNALRKDEVKQHLPEQLRRELESG